MFSVAQVAHPGFQGGGVVFADGVAFGDDGGRSGDGRPFAGGVEEGDVDVRVGREVRGFAGFGVGVEEEVDAAGFLGKRGACLVSNGARYVPRSTHGRRQEGGGKGAGSKKEGLQRMHPAWNREP